MRPGELYELRHPDIDPALNRINVNRSVFRGEVDTPKTGKRTIGPVPPARAILLRQPTRIRDDGLVFISKIGRRLSSRRCRAIGGRSRRALAWTSTSI
jgi:hypothetical protein